MKKIYSALIFLLFSIGMHAQTYVSGGIFTNTTWTLSNSPYIVTNTLTLFPGDTLTIEPGVVVKFDSSVIFEVRGNLRATGTIHDSILFSSSSPNPYRGIWRGINIRDDLGGSGIFNYTVLKYGFYVLSLNWGSSGVPLNVRNSKFENNYAASNAGATLDVIIDSCYFTNNYIAITGGNKIVTNSVFMNNDYGLLIAENVDVYNCTFCGNTIALDGGRGNLQNCVIMNNGIGVRSHWEGFTNVSGNIISENDTGIMLTSSGVISNGLSINNKICNNYYYDLINWSYANIAIPNNCWCDTDSLTIANKIYDGYDNVTYGLIDFNPVLNCDTSALPDSTPCDGFFTKIVSATLQNNVIEIFPNPASEKLHIISSGKISQLRIFDLPGKELLLQNVNKLEFEINTRFFSPGIYFIQLEMENDIVVKKFIKK